MRFSYYLATASIKAFIFITSTSDTTTLIPTNIF